ncbi:hypothetical protein NP493_1878g00006 [Ridgeia piscesae]|uniref:DUF4371 domain-containing protein n=1 Tax=Ridgeia piscesae TaxID=27915 RepID=A0AAD9JQB1_RIDPI|nr:hypothetical protein NP493_1878g00006 [Ridgeia piscesae]
MFAYFVAEHNLPTAIADHVSSLAPRMFPDSGFAKSFKCRRMEMMMIVKRCLATEATGPVIAHCKSGPFSVMIDESTDRNTDKRLAVFVRYYDQGLKTAQTCLLDMPVCNGGTAQEIFDSLDGVLRKLEIDWVNWVGFASDNCNMMIGARNLVLSRCQETANEEELEILKQCQTHSTGCPCCG